MSNLLLGLRRNVYVPPGFIFPLYNTAVIPDSCARFTGLDGKHPVGAGGTYGILSSGGAQLAISKTTTSAGGHTGSGTPVTGLLQDAAGAGSGATFSGAGGTSGAHSHDVTATYNRPYRQLVFAKTLVGMENLPANAIVLSKEATAPLGSLSICYNVGDILKGGTFAATGGGVVGNQTCSQSGNHQGHHAYGTKYKNGGGQTAYQQSVSGASHSHTFSNFAVTAEELKRVCLTAWYQATAFRTAHGMIGLYESLTPPDGWRLMTELINCFIILCAAEDAGDVYNELNRVYIEGALADSNFGHSHQGSAKTDVDPNSSGGSERHGSITVPHNHTFAGWSDYTPPYYALAFIEKI